MGAALKTWTYIAAIAGLALLASQIAEIPFRSALRGYDNTFNYLWLRSAMVDGDWEFQNDLAACNTLNEEYRESALALPRTDAGRIPNKYGIGWAVMTLPFYLVADAIVAIARVLGIGSLQRDGFNWVYQVVIQFGQAALAVTALLLAWKTVSRWLGDAKAGRFGVLAVWTGSPLLYYQTVNLSMSHAAAFFSISAMAFALERATSGRESGDFREQRRWWLLAGAAFGLAVITRFQLAVFGVVVAWVVLAGCRRNPGESIRSKLARVGIVVAGALPFIALQLWAWHVIYGHWLVFSYGGEGEVFHWAKPELLNSLFSPWHGLFYWHPFLLVATAGTIAWATLRRGSAIAWCLAVAATIYVNAAWWCWWFASAFGSRAFDAALLPVMAGAAWLYLRARGRWRTALCVIAIIAGAWNAYLVLIYRTGAISRGDPATWGDMISAVARLPESLRF